MGHAATTRHLYELISAGDIDIIRFGDDGLAREHRGVLDALGMKQQIGAIPAAAPAE
jgi:hypothetical protein